MYRASGNEVVHEISSAPEPAPDVPSPVVYATDYHLVLAYNLSGFALAKFRGDPSVSWLDPDGEFVFIKFVRPYVHYMGAPNEEAVEGHPLYSKGIGDASIFRVENSSWIESLEQMNRVHERHDPTKFQTMKHFVFRFHDSTFEAVANEFEVVDVVRAGDDAEFFSLMAKAM